MQKTFFTLLLSFLFVLSGFSQENTEVSYENFCLEFVLSITTTTSIEDMEMHFDEHLKTEDLRRKLEIFKNEILVYQSRSEYELAKIDSPFLFYNIHVYDPDTQTSFGNLRLLFKDSKNYLIDDWIYLIDQDNLESMDSKLEELPPANFFIPHPPPPPPHKNN